MKRCSLSTLATVVYLLASPVWAGDWPQFRYDAGRTAASPHALPAELELHWVRTLPTPRPAFPHEVRLAFDASYQPVVLGDTMFVPSMVNDSVAALDTATGEERWRFIAEGPVRFAPVAWEGMVYFCSDDGYLYCLDAADGSLRWKFRGLPEERRDRRVVGNGRLVSLWPARGGPVMVDGAIYFAAGLWPTEGVFVHAVDARSGKPVWSNVDSHRIPASNWDHGIAFEAGLTPQGYLAVVGDRLVVPCGTQLPAFLDLRDGKLADYTMGWGGRVGLPKGCWFVAGAGNYLSHGGDLYDISRPYTERVENPEFGRWLYPGGWTRLEAEPSNQRELDAFRQPVLTAETMYESDRNAIRARSLTSVTLRKRTQVEVPPHRSDDTYPDTFVADFEQLWSIPSEVDVHIKAGDRLYAGGPGVVKAIDTAVEAGPRIVWHADIEGTPQGMLAAGGKLFVVTAEGTVLAFGAPRAGEVVRHPTADAPSPPTDAWTQKAADILEATGVRDGFALVLGIERGRLVEELVRQSSLQVIAVDTDAERVAALRHSLHAAGLYGTRATVLVGEPATYPFPRYVANLVVTEVPDRLADGDEQSLAKSVFRVLRPYGGVACAWGALAARNQMEDLVRNDAFAGATVREAGPFVLLARSGPLPGAADWSHAGANAANTGASEDDFVRSPKDILWFDASRRWHKYPGQIEVRVAGGRVVLLEEGLLRASDVYTGRSLWEVAVPVGVEPLADPLARDAARRTRQTQWGPPPSLSPATQLIALEDRIYLSDGTCCVVL
ncbi:MAG: PQQ-binding-like beta-propeller repeat protein, partial [Thermoguttaceae bacterium]